MKQEINFKSKETKLSQKLCGEGPLYLLLKCTIEKVQKGNLFVINNSGLPKKQKAGQNIRSRLGICKS